MDNFKITLDHTDNKTQIITCTERNLYIKVSRDCDEFPMDALAITITIQTKFIKGYQCCFEILYPTIDEQTTKWDINLFYDAIAYYCKEQFGAEPDGYELINAQNFYPYLDDDFVY